MVDAVLEFLDAKRDAEAHERFSIDESRDEYAYRRARYTEMLKGAPRSSEAGREAGSQVYMFDALRSQLMLELAKAERDTLIGMALHSKFHERMIRKAIQKSTLESAMSTGS